jgi:DNA-binding PadR family transcriptional regulator
MGAVYATLGRLEERGLLRSRESEPMPVRGGRARRVYTPTPAGRTALNEAATMLLRMMEGLAFGPGRGT